MRILQWGVYLVVFCLPLYLIRFKIFNIPTTALELMIYGLFIIWLIKIIRSKNQELRIKIIEKLIIPVVLILIGVSIATIFSWDLRVSLGIWKAWFIDPILFFIVVVSIIKNIEQIKKIFYSLIFSGLVVSIISLIYLIQGNLDIQGRLQGFYNSPNYLAMYLAPVLIINFWFLMVFKKDYSLRMVFLANNLFLLITLFFTKSFGAWFGILVALGFGVIIYLNKTKNKKIIWGIILGIILIILIFIFLKFGSIQGKLSINSRIGIWQKAWEVFKMYPIMGIGPGTFQDYFPAYPRWGVPQPHNLYLAFLLQTGSIGFIGFIWLLIWFFRSGFKILVIDCWLPITVLMSIMVYILVHGLVDTTYWKNDLSLMFWLIIGAMTAIKNPR